MFDKYLIQPIKHLFWKPHKFSEYPDYTLFVLFHHEWDSVNSLISSFKNYYPEGDVIISRDSLNFSPNEPLIRYPYKKTQTYSCMQKFIDLVWDRKTEKNLTPLECLNLIDCHIQRLVEVAKLAKNDWILAVEPDCKINKKVPIQKHSDIDILEVNKFSDEYIQSISNISGKKFEAKGWGFVVGPIKKELILGIHKWYIENPTTVMKLIRMDKRIVVLDFLIVVMSHFANASIVNSNLITECYRNKFWKLTSRPLLHQYKPKKLHQDIRQMALLAKRNEAN